MSGNIIQSGSEVKRSRLTAFTLSFFFTGLGQVYCGEPARGFIFLTGRILLFLIIPANVILSPSDSFLLFVAAAAAINTAVWLLSSLEPVFSIPRRKVNELKNYNRPVFYALFAVSETLIILISIVFISAFFSVKHIDSEDLAPGILTGEYLLINTYETEIKRGDLIIFNEGSTGVPVRVIALPGDNVKGSEGMIYVNDVPLSKGIYSDAEIADMGLSLSENLFYEINESRKYPVLAETGKNGGILKKGMSHKMAGNMFFSAADNRTIQDPYKLIDKKNITGRVEGIVFSENLKRLLTEMFSKI
jgi:signal peptidase I